MECEAKTALGGQFSTGETILHLANVETSHRQQTKRVEKFSGSLGIARKIPDSSTRTR